MSNRLVRVRGRACNSPRPVRSNSGILGVGGLLVLLSLTAGPASAELLSGPADAVIGAPQITVLSADVRRTVVQVTFPVEQAPGDWSSAERVDWRGLVTEDRVAGSDEIVSFDPIASFQVAVAERRRPTWRVAALQWHRQPSDPGVPVATVGAPAVFRSVPLAPVNINAGAGGGILAGVVVEIDHAAGPRSQEDAASRRRAEREPMPATVVNGERFRELSAHFLASPPVSEKAVPLPDLFSLTSHWIRLELDDHGVYQLTGGDLEPMGLALTDIDPTTLRVFKGGGLTLDDDPEVSDDDQADRVGLTELAVVVDDGGDGEFDTEDRVLFYGFGTDIWLDRLDSAATQVEFYNHAQQAHGVYWLTWEEFGTASPLPGSPRRVASSAADPTGGNLVERHRARYHGEENVAYIGGYVRDNWAWDSFIRTSFTQPFNVEGVVAGESADWNFDVVAQWHRNWGFIDPYETRSFLNSDSDNAVPFSWIYRDQRDTERIRISGSTSTVVTGQNRINFIYDNVSATQSLLAFDSFDVVYTASLDKREFSGALACVFWGDEVTVPGTASDVRFTLPTTGDWTLWDVTRPDSAHALTGTVAGSDPRTLTVGMVRDPGDTRHLILFDDGDLLRVLDGERVEPVPLRQTVPAAHYLVIYPQEFEAAAAALADLRSRELPEVDSPHAEAVLLDDIFANFSGGQKDWRAIRQFVRWHYLEHGRDLLWICLLGDASRDYRNFLGHDPQTELVDWVPTSLVTEFPWVIEQYPLSVRWPYVADEAMTALDTPPNNLDYDIPDLAIGRLPATSPTSALQLVEQLRTFVEDQPEGVWRNEMVFCADDLYQGPGDQSPEPDHTRQAEILANGYLPESLDINKVYLVDYPYVGSYKPDARRHLLTELDAGASLFYYVGHGSAEVLADEQVFRIDDIGGLTNGDRRFFFMAFSCDVGVFDEPNIQCMGEEFVTATQGGAIATVTASWVSLINLNETLSEAFCSSMYPGRLVARSSTVGESLILAKAEAFSSNYAAKNGRRYNVIGDPATHLPNPVNDIEFVAGTADSLLTGRLHEMQVAMDAAGIDPGPDAEYRLRVQESSVDETYFGSETWRRIGNDVFRGNGALMTGDTPIPFQAPISLRLGDRGRFRCIVNDGDEERVAFEQPPVVQVAAATDDVVGPNIVLAFPGGRTRVRPGDQLNANLSDPSGVNILASNPANSVLLEFDSSGIFNNVSGDVVFEPGSFQTAALNTALPADLELGSHAVVISATDMFGNVGRDTLRFELEATSVAAMRDATVFPNPTPGPCRLVVDLSAPMDLQWDIYTVSGRRVRTVQGDFPADGPAILNWDGRDGEGDEIANGVYLYVLRGQMDGDSHGFQQTGQLVIMR